MPLLEYLKTLGFAEFVVPGLIGLATAVIVTPLVGFVGKTVSARAAILTMRLLDMKDDNMALAAMVEAFGHKQKSTHDLLVHFADRAREIRDRQISTLEDLEDLKTEFGDWNDEVEAQLKPLLRYTEFQRLRDAVLSSPPSSEAGTWHNEHREIRHWLRHRIDALDNLIRSEYTPPNPYFTPSALRIAERHVPRS
jgi:hypothetical protein